MAAGDQQKIPEKPILGKDTLWLVKSGDRIFGPLVTGEIVRRLRSKELVVIDEVISPQSRWRHIRDESIFASVVDEIRTGLMTVRDDTEVGDGTGGTPTIKSRSLGDDSTPVQQFRSDVTNATFESSINVSRISDADIVSESDEVEKIHHASAREIESRKGASGVSGRPQRGKFHSTLSYEPPDDENGRDPSLLVSKTSRVLWTLVGAAVLVISVSIYFFKIAPANRADTRSEEVQRLRGEADRAWSRGEFLRSLKLYEQINRDSHPDLETDLRQAILQLRIERETLAAKRRLQELIPKLNSPQAIMRARIALAVADLQSDETLEAQNALIKIVQEPDSGPIALFNLGCAQAASGLLAEAIATLKKLDSNPTLGSPARLLQAILYNKNGAPKLASTVIDLEGQGMQPAWRQELYAVGAASDWLDGNKKRSSHRLRIALDSDPLQTEEFFYDPLIYLEAVRWKHILPSIKEFANRSKSNAAKSLYALALIKADRRPEAQQLLSESLSPRVGDADLQSINAYSLMTQGRDDEARGALKFAQTVRGANGGSGIASILEARLCERGADQSCADTIWSELAKRSNPPIAALVSVARVNNKVATEKGLDAVERLSLLYPHSILVIKLHDDVFSSSSKK